MYCLLLLFRNPSGHQEDPDVMGRSSSLALHRRRAPRFPREMLVKYGRNRRKQTVVSDLKKKKNVQQKGCENELLANSQIQSFR